VGHPSLTMQDINFVNCSVLPLINVGCNWLLGGFWRVRYLTGKGVGVGIFFSCLRQPHRVLFS